MIDFENLETTVVEGLIDYLKHPLIASNQNRKPPTYPYGSYTVTTLKTQNRGTWQEHEDGLDRKAVRQIWSLSFLSDNDIECTTLACSAHEWLEHVGRQYLKSKGVTVLSVGPIGNRDNVLTAEYEYKKGFDVTFSLYDTVARPHKNTGYIESVDLNKEV